MADVRHVHSGECPLTHGREEKVREMQQAVEELGGVVRKVGPEDGEEVVEEGRKRGGGC